MRERICMSESSLKIEKPVCDFGCGQEAHYLFKTGRWCCSEKFHNCPGMKKRWSELQKGSTPWNKGKTYNLKNKPEAKPIEINDGVNHLCDYGCNQRAKYQFRNGKFCCSETYNSCPGKRERDSELKKGKIPVWKNGHPKGATGKPSWNKGKVLSAEHRANISEALKGVSTGKASTPEKEAKRRERLSEALKRHPNGGGYRKNSGVGKQGWYKGYWCDSSWELAFVIYSLEHGINFERNWEKFEYIWNYEKHYYFPDFKLEDGTYIEIKGYFDNKNRAKIESFEKPLIILSEKEIQPMIEYVIKKYGKEYISLYQKKDEYVENKISGD